ncbi:MAG: IS4 family transposase, partial [Planctomycetes bacterium]|nr:IS4 family transposase [Planctomycetota bacterium]
LAHARSERLPMLYQELLKAVASHEIGNRPDRLEPRQRKRRPKPYALMTKPRNEARRRYGKTR